MKPRRAALLVLLLIQHTLFVALTVWLAPTESSFAALFLAWMILPALTAAIVWSAARKHIVAAAVNGAVAATLLDYLFLVHGYYWHEPPEISITLALVDLLLGIGVATACGAFVHVIITSLERHSASTMKQRLTVAARKGLSFSVFCVAVSLPVLLLLLPPGASSNRFWISLGYAFGGIVSGVVVASIVGALYASPLSSHTP